jgi:hypothetical protein
MRTASWWERLDDEDVLLMRWMKTIYLSTLNWADKEFFLTFLYIASLGQAWQNPSNINPRVELRALISSIRSNINPRVELRALISSIRSNINSRIEFELLFETQFYGQARTIHKLHQKYSYKSKFVSRVNWWFQHCFWFNNSCFNLYFDFHDLY